MRGPDPGVHRLLEHLRPTGHTENKARLTLCFLQGLLEFHGTEIPMQFSQSRDLKMIDVSKLQTDWNCPKVDVVSGLQIRSYLDMSCIILILKKFGHVLSHTYPNLLS